TEESDVDFVMDYTDSTIDNLESLSDIRLDLETKFNKKIDLVPINSSSGQIDIEHFQTFIRKVINERVQIYERN
ncbi:MAG: hypothetical protein LBF58_12060, partial [Deltaproteobacteria bacterium]|nr:hypothetical protein [Deltaproteobacteria bacterium]